MRKLLLAAAAILGLASSAHAQVPRASWPAQILSCFPDNLTGQITPATMRNCWTLLINSITALYQDAAPNVLALTAGSPAGTTNPGDVNIAGQFKVNGSAIAGGAALPLIVSNGGTGQANAQAARGVGGLGIDEYTGVGDANYTILSTDKTVGTNAAFTASRTWTLPTANAVNPGQSVKVLDTAGGVTSSNTLVIAAAPGNTINGGSSVTINAGNGGYLLVSDGVNRWSAQALGVTASSGVASIGGQTGAIGLGPGVALSGSTIGGDPAVWPSAVRGLVLSNNTATTFFVSSGAVVTNVLTGPNATIMELASTFQKTVNVAWVAGTLQGCLDNSTLVVPGWVHVFLMENTTSTATDVLCSQAAGSPGTVTISIASPAVISWAGAPVQPGSPVVFTTTGALPTGIVSGTTYYVIAGGYSQGVSFEISATQGGSAINTSGSQSGTHTATSNPIFPTGYNAFRRIGSLHISAGPTIDTFAEVRNNFILATPSQTGGFTLNANAHTLISVGSPIGTTAQARMRFLGYSNTNSVCYLVQSPDETSAVPDAITGNTTSCTSGANVFGTATVDVRTNASSQIRANGDATNNMNFYAVTYGWVDLGLQ